MQSFDTMKILPKAFSKATSCRVTILDPTREDRTQTLVIPIHKQEDADVIFKLAAYHKC